MADEGLRFEAFTMPHVGALTKRCDFTKFVESYTLNDRFNDLSDGVFTIPDDAALATGTLLRDKLLKIDESDHANDVGSMVRVLRGTTPIMHYMTTRSEDAWSDGEPVHKFSLEGLEWILDRSLVPRKDTPADPSKDPDWIFGAPSVLLLSDFEGAVETNLVFWVWTNATGGTFTLTIGGQTTAAVNYNAGDDGTLQTAIENLSNVDDVVVSGFGTEANPWVVEVIDPEGTDFTLVFNGGGLTGGTGAVSKQVTGGRPEPTPWTVSYHPTLGVQHGSYEAFEISTDQNHTTGGTYSLKVNTRAPRAPGDFGGAQQLVSVTGGKTYRAEVWVRPTATGPFRFVIRTLDETLIASTEASLTLNTWTKLSLSFVVPEHIDRIIFRIATISNSDEPAWYVDDAVLAPGAAAATYGDIMLQLRTAAIASSAPLSWLTPTFSATLDSDGAAWDQTLSWSVSHGQTFLQLIEYARRWNYEHRIRWDAGDNRFEWDLWNPNNGGQTRTGIAVHGKGGGTGSSPIVRKPPPQTYTQVEGIDGAWGEATATSLTTVWGTLQKFHQDRHGVDSTLLDTLASRFNTTATNQTAARSVTLADPTLIPWTNFEPGDFVTLNLAPKDTKRSLRVAAIVAHMSGKDAVPTYDIHFVNPVLSEASGMAQGVRNLLRAFNRPTPSTSLDGRPTTVPIITAGRMNSFSLPGQAFVEVGRLRLSFGIMQVAVLGVTIMVNTAPTGASLIVDVNKNGTTIFTSQAARPTIAASAFASSEAVPAVNTVAAGEYLTVDVDQVGSTIPGGDLTINVRWAEVATL